MSIIIDGKKVSTDIKDEVKEAVSAIVKEGGKVALAVVIVGDDSASKIYVKNKEKACLYTGILSKTIELPYETTEEELLDVIGELNSDPSVNGILVQMPLPSHIDKNHIIDAISYLKDVDGFHPVNVGKMAAGQDCFLPCTPHGIIELLKRYNVPIDHKNCVIVGRSDIVGKPVARLMLKENATVTVCHSHTEDLALYTRTADIIIAAVGKRHVITADMVKEGVTIIDVGMNRDENGKLYGDCDFDTLCEKASYITPVPGGVGPMTIAMLMKNCLLAYEMQKAGKF